MRIPGIPFGKWFRSSPHVLLKASGGFSSGDRALCIAAARRIQSAGCRLTILSPKSYREDLRHSGIHAPLLSLDVTDTFEGTATTEEMLEQFERVHKNQYHDILKSFEKVNVLAVAPGGRLLDGYKVARHLLIPALAQRLGVPVVFFHQSVGPLTSPAHRSMVQRAFTGAALGVTRDDISFAFLRELGVPESRLFPSRDMAFTETYPDPNPPTEFDLGVNVRFGFNGHTEPDVLKVFLREFIRHKPGARVLLYTTSNPIPAPLADEMRAMTCAVEPALVAYPDYVRAPGRCAVNISDSFHGVIFSMMAGRPVIALQTDFGSWKLHGTLVPGQPAVEVLSGFIDAPSARDILDRALALAENPTPACERQLRFVEYCRKRAEDGWEQAARVILNAR